MSKTLYLLDGMALIYRAHFALIRSPIYTSKGENTSALYGFTNTLLDLIENQKPDMLAIALDTSEPTERHKKFPAYKAQRDEIPEDIVTALPNIDRLAAVMNIPLLKAPGFEADDIIGTLAKKYASDELNIVMVTPDKDFAQLVAHNIRMYKPGRMGKEAEILSEDDVKAAWNVTDPSFVADILGLWGDASDNIPGVPGIGEKTAKKLIGQYGTLEGIYEHLDDFKGKQKENLENFREQAFLSRDLATIITNVPLDVTPAALEAGPYNDEALQKMLIEFEFNSIGRRLYGETFKAGRGHQSVPSVNHSEQPDQGELFGSDIETEQIVKPNLKSIETVPHVYELIDDDNDVAVLAKKLSVLPSFCFDLETDSLDSRTARIAGIAFSWSIGSAVYVNLNVDDASRASRINHLQPALLNTEIEKIGHNLKFDISVLAWNGIDVDGPLFDTMIAHALLEPDRRHGMDALSEQYLGYSPVPISKLIGEKKATQKSMFDLEPGEISDYAAEDADVTLQLKETFFPLLKKTDADKIFREIEMPLLPVMIRMERQGIRLDTAALQQASIELTELINKLELQIFEIAGTDFNLNSPKQLGEILFDKLALIEKPRKTKTGQYKTDESVLNELAVQHEIARLMLEHREASKLKSTYVDALPQSVFKKTNRIHTTFSQVGAITGRLASSNPNLQNIPIRSSMGQQIRAAFIPGGDGFTLLSADYSQIELRVMAELSGDAGMLEAFCSGQDIHASTAAKVYKIGIEDVTPDMRRKAKMVNFGIIYGISAFGLSQRLGIPRKEAVEIIDQYFTQYPKVKEFMDRTIEECKAKGYVETLTGRRRWIRDINSSNGTIRSGAERTAINTPIQGTAADMIKLAMIRIDEQLIAKALKTKMLLQVHDELVFDLAEGEKETVIPLVRDCMQNAIAMNVPIVVETGTGDNWLQAH